MVYGLEINIFVILNSPYNNVTDYLTQMFRFTVYLLYACSAKEPIL
jgi:hypothetical protein